MIIRIFKYFCKLQFIIALDSGAVRPQQYGSMYFEMKSILPVTFEASLILTNYISS
jgi:hypothetical protein